ncbi:hypothetical protein JVU11DRAFT_1597 [Chiua virens]|nr:hypothetical protein JVU11DRAFT_1597 [Chiua virens]
MEYNPRHPQPFTLTQAIALDPEVAWDGLFSGSSSSIAVANTPDRDRSVEKFLAALETDERIFILKLALTHHGHSVTSDQTSEPPTYSPRSTPRSTIDRSRNVVGSNSNGLDSIVPLERTSTVNLETTDVVEQENGVYL